MYVTTPQMMRIIGKNGVDWKEFDPAMFEGDYEPRVKLKSTVYQDKQRTMRNVKEMYTALLGSPFVEQSMLTRLVISRAFDLEPDEVDNLLVPEEKLAKMAEGEQGKDGTDPKELLNYKDAPPDIKAQMEIAAGYEPSPTHEGEIEALAATQFNDEITGIETAMPGDTPMGVAPVMPPQPPMGGPELG
jgi:hypothetical protein